MMMMLTMMMEKQKAMHLVEPSGNGDMVISCRQRPGLAQRHGGKVSRFGAEKRRQGVTEKVWKGRGWRREGEKRTMVEESAQAQLFLLGRRAVKRSPRPRSHGSRSRRLKSAASASHAMRQNHR